MMHHPINAIASTALMVALIGCGSAQQAPSDTSSGNEQHAPTDISNNNVESYAKIKQASRQTTPFEYKVISKEESRGLVWTEVIVWLETTNEVARNATKKDLRALLHHIVPNPGDRQIALRLKTSVPGAMPWGVISRLNTDGEWKVNVTIHEFGIDQEPYHFVNVIDRSVLNQRAMIVTLPVVNHANEYLIRHGWKVKQRQEKIFSAEFESGIQSVSVILTPESIRILAHRANENTLTDTTDAVFSELGIANKLKNKLYSVIGSPEYVRAVSGDPAQWSWTIGDIEVTYSRLPEMDDISAEYFR